MVHVATVALRELRQYKSLPDSQLGRAQRTRRPRHIEITF